MASRRSLLWAAVKIGGLISLLSAGPVFAEQPSAAQLQEGKALFTDGAVPACSICHTLEAAGSKGTIGPVLDELKPDAALVIKAIKQGVGAMPAYEDKLTEAQIKTLAAFVSESTGGNR